MDFLTLIFIPLIKITSLILPSRQLVMKEVYTWWLLSVSGHICKDYTFVSVLVYKWGGKINLHSWRLKNATPVNVNVLELCSGWGHYAVYHVSVCIWSKGPRRMMGVFICAWADLGGFIPALVEKETLLPLSSPFPCIPRALLWLTGLNVYLGRIGFDPGGSATGPRR